MKMTDSQRYHWNLYLITVVEDIVVFLGLKMLTLNNSYVFLHYKYTSHFCTETTFKNNQFCKFTFKSIDDREIRFFIAKNMMLAWQLKTRVNSCELQHISCCKNPKIQINFYIMDLVILDQTSLKCTFVNLTCHSINGWITFSYIRSHFLMFLALNLNMLSILFFEV